MLTFISSLMKKNILGNLFILIILISIKPISLTAQENQFYSSSNILSMLEKLDLFGKPVSSDKVIINSNPDLLNILVIDCGIKNSQLDTPI